MGFLSKLFGSRPEVTFSHPVVGVLTLGQTAGRDHYWTGRMGELYISCHGTGQAPYKEHLDLLEKATAEIERIGDGVTLKFKELFTEADLPVDFERWQDRFGLTCFNIENTSPETTEWTVSFYDTRSEDIASYNLYIVDGKPSDFSIDT